jgi:hypothetical protein
MWLWLSFPAAVAAINCLETAMPRPSNAMLFADKKKEVQKQGMESRVPANFIMIRELQRTR